VKRDHTLLSFLPRLALGVGGTLALASAPALAKDREAAATLLPARPAPAPLVARGSTPEASLPSSAGAYVPSVPAPNYGGARIDTNGAKATWAGGKLTVLKDSVFGKPNAQDPKPREPEARLVAPPTNPLFGGGTPAAAQPQPAPRGVYASPPAYRWYGWGGTTPGSNPYSPTGVYPQGSANWYAQSGATPGAFPLTPTTRPVEAVVEPPAYAGNGASDPPFIVGVPAATSEPKPRFISGPPIPEPSIVARTPIGFAPPPPPEMPATPSLPGGMPVAIAGSSEGRMQPAEPISTQATELNWQTAGGRGIAPKDPIPLPPPPMPPMQPVVQPSASEPAWATVPAKHGGAKPAVPTISLIRGQVENREPQSLDAIIRSTCVGRVVSADVRANGAGKLVVTFVAASESAAREAAALVAKLPELKPYEVTFEARVAPR